MVVKKILRDWTLLIAMVLGVLFSVMFTYIPFFSEMKSSVHSITSKMMPVLMFTMLFLSFTSISPKDIKLRKWHLWHSLFQLTCSSVLLFVVLPLDREIAAAIFVCLICPTAVASSVITDKLHGNVASLVSYVLIINIVVSIAIPLILPVVSYSTDITFLLMALRILKKVFPLLVIPIISVWALRLLCPKIHEIFFKNRGLSFYIWALTLVILISDIVDAIFLDGVISLKELSIMGVSMLCCIIQFVLGRIFGKKYADAISAGQALGQKNTIFAIWLATTFISPVVALAPGSYILWQNIINSIELKTLQK